MVGRGSSMDRASIAQLHCLVKFQVQARNAMQRSINTGCAADFKPAALILQGCRGGRASSKFTQLGTLKDDEASAGRIRMDLLRE